MDKSKTAQATLDEIWDDTLLIKAYDESVKLAKEELAKRIAESTNTKLPQGSAETKKSTTAEDGTKEDTCLEITFKVGDYVRATYDDGVDYEAKILSINEGEGKCLLKYVGYENEQEVELNQLVPSWGKKARRMQFMQSKQDQGGGGGNPNDVSGVGKEKKSKVRQQVTELPFDALPPLPPMPPMLNDVTEDSEHLSAMLMSWYMSGYYTGLYHGRKMSASSRSRGKVAKK